MLDLKPIPPKFSTAQIAQLLATHYGVDCSSLTDLGSYIDQNILVIDQRGKKSVLKIHDGAEQQEVIECQIKAAAKIAQHLSQLQLPLTVKSPSGNAIEQVADSSGQKYSIRLIHFVEGDMLKDLSEFSSELLEHVGKTVAGTDVALSGYYTAAANRPDIPWDLKNARQVSKLSRYIKCPNKRRLADYFFMKFENEVESVLLDTRKSVVHGDLHRYSMMVTADASAVSGIIDFGDLVYTHTICNLAVCLSDIMIDSEDPIVTAGTVVKAYHRQFPITEQEVSILHYLVCTRLAVYVAMAAYSADANSANKHTRLKEEQVWNLIKRLIEVNPIRAEDVYRQSCGFDSLLSKHEEKAQENLAKRHNMFSNMLYTHYKEPLHVTGGALQYLYDNKGNTYFDCVNNVSQWGHSNPHIVRPAQLQISRLNTNSRYVYDLMTDYAEQLLATFPDELEVVFFTNSGSEANDLAMRMVRTVTGQDDIVVVDTAYHGNSTACTEISPNRIDRPGKPGLAANIHKISAPDTYRGKHLIGEDNLGEKYGNEVTDIIDELAKEGKGPAAFISESLVGTGGQFVLPENYLNTVYKHVRKSGGLCIADEVQVGFGRTGDHTWCFESQNVVPDIVTFGKPMANGHPMAALVTTRAIADKFDNGITFFNTFSANPVSCAFGKAVLDVLQHDKIEDNVKKQSARMFEGLNLLKEKYEFVGDVRGLGLYIGVELVKSKVSKEPATEIAQWAIEALKQRFILLNTNGYGNNIIKIKPALTIEEDDVDRLVDALDKVFAEVDLNKLSSEK